jgi:hypothetical protein
MAKVVKLSVHKNTKEKMRVAKLRKELKYAAVQASKEFPPTGYAVVLWNDDGLYNAYYSTSASKLNPTNLPELAKDIITRIQVTRGTK